MATLLAWAPLPVTPKRYAWACANTLIQQYGHDAWFHASLRADELLATGDLDGYAMFQTILTRIEELQRTQVKGLVH